MRKVIKPVDVPTDVVRLGELRTSTKIYGCVYHNRIYKLHRIDDRWMFCSMQDSLIGTTGHHGDSHAAVAAEIKYTSVYEFNTSEEFFRWALEQVNG